ncbi:MAG: leucine-rich repeat domain-containing protein [Alphaproteobacteria bacterium]|nr:leucine-rich repeat domain-containing protein [Alphaproteobacteria bacterium]MCB9793675.1 leucine-rich repeat domain-containing protein [Alphaproteobacteria bacterium]
MDGRIRTSESLHQALAGDPTEVVEVFLQGPAAAAACRLLCDLDRAPFPSLQRLVLVDAGIEALPEWLGELQRLQSLVVWGNALRSLPDSTADLCALARVDAGGNQLTELPEPLAALPTLQRVDLSRNPLRRLTATHAARIEVLDVRSCGLTALGADLARLPSLRELSASDNEIATVSEGVGELSGLRRLDLSRNRLRSLPATLASTALEILALWGNPLGALPAVVLQLAGLRHLDLGHCGLSHLPEGLGQLRALAHLDLSGNELGSLPQDLGQLPELGWLDLDETPLASRLDDDDPEEVGATLSALGIPSPPVEHHE